LNVPTWNYAAAHARCRIRRIEDAAGIDRILQALVDRFEREQGEEGAWKYDLPSDFKDGLVRAILGVELEILEVQSKFKLSQNRKAEDYEPLLAHFAARSDDRGREVHRLMLRSRRGRD
jgi:transcriptional regulator